jgi:hypothetical protein
MSPLTIRKKSKSSYIHHAVQDIDLARKMDAFASTTNATHKA